MFRDSFKNKLFAKFKHIDSDNNTRLGGSLLQHFQTERTDPMFIPPLKRTVTQIDGGFLTLPGQIKNPLIRNNANDQLFKMKRFEPSQSAVSNLNRLQNTKRKINEHITGVCINLLYDLVNEFKSKLKINESRWGYQIDYEEKFPKFAFSQIGEWIETMHLTEYMMQENVENSGMHGALIGEDECTLVQIFFLPKEMIYRVVCSFSEKKRTSMKQAGSG